VYAFLTRGYLILKFVDTRFYLSLGFTRSQLRKERGNGVTSVSNVNILTFFLVTLMQILQRICFILDCVLFF